MQLQKIKQAIMTTQCNTFMQGSARFPQFTAVKNTTVDLEQTCLHN